MRPDIIYLILNHHCPYAGLVIPENDLSTSISITSESQVVKNGSHTDGNKQKTVLSTPPWKGGHSDAQNSSISKYSPAFKRKPFTVYSTGNIKPPTARQNSQSQSSVEGQSSIEKRDTSSSARLKANQLASKPVASANAVPTGKQASISNNKNILKDGSEKQISNLSRRSNLTQINKVENDSDNDSAVSSARSSLSHSSGSACVSPPSSPPLGSSGKQDDESTTDDREGIKSNSYPDASKDIKKSHSRTEGHTPSSATNSGSNNISSSNQAALDKNPRILQKHSVEAINRRNILESCKKSSAKDTMLIPPIEGKPKKAETSPVATTIKLSTESVQKAVSNPKHETNSTNTSRTTNPVAKERRSISSSSRATSFPLGIF